MSLLQRALTDLDRGSDDIVELFGPERVRDIAIAMLRGCGCKLDGSTVDVERLLGYATKVDVQPWLREWRKSFEPAKSGRPTTNLFEIMLYTAALYRFRGKVKNPAAAAAKWLGHPATKDKVEKRDKAFRRIFGRVYEHIGVPRSIGLERSAELLVDVTLDLENLDAKMAEERAAGFRAKKGTRHASFSAQLSPAS
ncbi:hypothetical protein NKI78_26985 [Mesorhizobium sp. M0400]|uniref:hypothetical protein n=1 Tax=Mesorhizobium sp. M0400 TaxID=2956941 RepID=UPI0033392081